MSEMSNITEEQVTALLEQQKKNFESRLERAEARSGFTVDSVDYNPKTKWTYESDGVHQPRYDKPIKDHDKWMKIYYPKTEADRNALAGSSDRDLEESCYSNEYLGRYQEMKALLNKAEKNDDKKLFGSVITSNDFSILRVEANVSKVLGFQLSANVLEQAVTTQATPNLVARYRTWSGFEIEPHVGEGVIVEAKKGQVTENTFQIKKDVGAAAITIEAELTTEGDIFGDHVSWIAKKMRKLRNTKIATALATTTTSVSGADWGVYTGDRSTNDPGETFLTVVNALNGASNRRYELNTLVSNPQPKREYFQNSFIKGIFPAAPSVTTSPATFQTPGIEGNVTWYSDVDITTTTIVYAYDKEVVVLFEGPKRQTEIGRPDAEVREYYSRDFNDVFIIDQTGIRKITGITA